MMHRVDPGHAKMANLTKLQEGERQARNSLESSMAQGRVLINCQPTDDCDLDDLMEQANEIRDRIVQHARNLTRESNAWHKAFEAVICAREKDIEERSSA
jgi:hypothetical protein